MLIFLHCIVLFLQSLLPKFLLNGYETVELFCQLDEGDLDQLEILDPEHRATILTAVTLIRTQEDNTKGRRSAWGLNIKIESPRWKAFFVP